MHVHVHATIIQDTAQHIAAPPHLNSLAVAAEHVLRDGCSPHAGLAASKLMRLWISSEAHRKECNLAASHAYARSCSRTHACITRAIAC